jgi:hypothetical protein
MLVDVVVLERVAERVKRRCREECRDGAEREGAEKVQRRCREGVGRVQREGAGRGFLPSSLMQFLVSAHSKGSGAERIPLVAALCKDLPPRLAHALAPEYDDTLCSRPFEQQLQDTVGRLRQDLDEVRA